MTLTRRQTLIGGAASVAAASVLPAVATAAPRKEMDVIRMTPTGCRHILNVQWIGYGAPDLIRVGDMFQTKMQDRETGRQVWLMAIKMPEIE
jgi:hypothetical protein